MEAAIDRFGRIVIPKRLRDALGLVPGSVVRIGLHEHTLVLDPVANEAPLEYDDGVLVFTGELVGDPADAVRLDRERRLMIGHPLRGSPVPAQDHRCADHHCIILIQTAHGGHRLYINRRAAFAECPADRFGNINR